MTSQHIDFRETLLFQQSKKLFRKMEALLYLSFRQIFLEVLNLTFVLKNYQEIFCKWNILAGCSPFWRKYENRFSPVESFLYHKGGWCQNCMIIEDLASLYFYEEFCKMRLNGPRGVLQFCQLAEKIRQEVSDVAGFDLRNDTVFLRNVEQEIFDIDFNRSRLLSFGTDLSLMVLMISPEPGKYEFLPVYKFYTFWFMCLNRPEDEFPDFDFIFNKIKDGDTCFFAGSVDDQSWFVKLLKMYKRNEYYLSFVLENRIKI